MTALFGCFGYMKHLHGIDPSAKNEVSLQQKHKFNF